MTGKLLDLILHLIGRVIYSAYAVNFFPEARPLFFYGFSFAFVQITI